MRITELKINHYKSIENTVHIGKFSEFHILVGPNNAGKTNVLDAIYATFYPQTDKERLADKNTDIEITIQTEEGTYKVTNRGGKITCDNKELTSKVKQSFARVGGDSSFIYEIIPQKLKNFKDKYPSEYVKFSDALNSCFKDIEISEELFLLNVHADNKERPVKRMGEGFKRLFIMLFYIFNPEYKIIFIDEPELHLHPSIIKKLLFLLQENKKKQIFITTHHPTFVQAHYLEHIWRVARNKNKSTSVYYFSKRNINTDRLVQEINDENSAMFFADKVLLVEGVSDKIFMTEIINRFYEKDKDIKVVYTGGKGTVDLYASLCDLFHIPYAIMLDSDALNSHSLQRVKKYISAKKKNSSNLKEELEEKEIFLLDGDLEHLYPSGHKRKETKPLSALAVSKKIKKEDLESPKMEIIKRILEKI